MAHFAEINIPGFVSYCAGSAFTLEGLRVRAKQDFKSIFEEHRHRIYSLAFYMTDNELTAEEISTRVFLRAFHRREKVNAEIVDQELVYVLRELTPIGPLTLNEPVTESQPVAGQAKRHLLERAVMEIPSTERLAFLLHDVEGYDHAKVAATLGISEEESKRAVFQARLAVRKHLAAHS